MTETVVTGSFDDFRSRHVRLLDEASSRGPLHVLLWSDETIRRLGGREPKFPQEERRYFLAAVRHVEQTTLADATSHEALLDYVAAVHPQCWVVDEASVTDSQRSFCESHGIEYCVLGEQTLNTFPPLCTTASRPRPRPQEGDRHRLLRLVPLRACPVLRGVLRIGRAVRRRRQR